MVDDPQIKKTGDADFAPGIANEQDEEGINLLDLLIILLKHKKMIFAFVFLIGLLAVFVSLRMPNRYRSECTIASNSQERGVGGLAALGGIGAMVASEAGLNTAGSLEQFEVVLKSRQLANTIVTQHNLLPVLFEKSWDSAQKRWRKKPPTLQGAYRVLTGMMQATPDKKKGIMKLSVANKNPRLAKQILDHYVLGLSEFLRRQTLDDATAQQAQLYQQLEKTSDPLLKNKLYDLIAKQIEKETLAKVQEYYSFKVIDPSYVPEKKFKPQRSLIVIVSVFMAFFLAATLAFSLEYLSGFNRENADRLARLKNALRLRSRP